MIGQLLDGIITGAVDAARVLLMSRSEERRWLNADRGDHRPTYAPPITRHYQAWPGGDRAEQSGPWPYQPWPGDDR